MAITILSSSADIRRAIGKLMSPGKVRRVAITAFVGDGARKFLRNPKGVEIVCWPQAGGTNRLELNRLKTAGARIRFADRLHMKLYWAARRGAIITSANLSTNALGAGDLKEFGVLLPANAISIDKVLHSVRSHPFNISDMRRLERDHRTLKARQGNRHPAKQRVTYQEWFTHPARSEWRLGWWSQSGVVAKSAKEITRTEYNQSSPYSFVSCRTNEYEDTNWVLTFRLTDGGASAPEWFYVDFVVPVSRVDKRAYDADYPCQAIQVHGPRYYESPPFAITGTFREALRSASKAFGVHKIERLRSARPPRKLLKMIRRRIK